MVVDVFDKLITDQSPIGKFDKSARGYFVFPKLEGPISNHMKFRGKEMLVWSVNNYLGLANHPEVRAVDEQATKDFGLSYPMGARMMSGNSVYHEELEQKLSEYVEKEDTILLNFGYQGCASAIDALVGRNDVIVYDSESHACIIDGVRMHQGKRYVFPHNDIEKLEIQLERATKLADKQNGGILVISEGVFGMAGDQGKLKEIVALKEKYNFRFFVDDAHGIGTLGKDGAGTGVEQGCQDGIDVYFGTFAKSFASIGAFISGDEKMITYLRYNTRSQMFAKTLPMPLVIGALKRLEIMRTQPAHRENLWKVANSLQAKLKANGFNLGRTNSAVTPVFLKGGPYEAANITFELREQYNIFCSIVVYPVVPKDTVMLRLIPTANHTQADVDITIETFNKILVKLENNEYNKEEIVAII